MGSGKPTNLGQQIRLWDRTPGIHVWYEFPTTHNMPFIIQQLRDNIKHEVERQCIGKA